MAGSARTRQQPHAVRDLLTPFLAQVTATSRPSAEEVARRWRQLVGAQAARHSQPTSLRGGELRVAVDTSAWLWNLSLQRPTLVRALQAAWGPEAVTVIRLRMRSPGAP